MLQVKLLSSSAQAPQKASALAAGYDIFASEKCVVLAHDRKLVKTDIAVAIPEGYYGRLAPRSGLALKKGIDVFAGVIDADYRGSVGVILYNSAYTDFNVQAGDRIAQLIIETCHDLEVRVVEDLASTQRGAGGFGSTGK